MKIQLSLKSKNKKTGPIPVSMSDRKSCPTNCQLKGNGCYAETGPLSWVWSKVPTSKTSLSWSQFCDQIKALPKGQLWRHNQAGDLPAHSDGTLSASRLRRLVRANSGRRGFTYTHHELSKINRAVLARVNNDGFTVNVSADNLYQAAEIFEHFKLPTVTMLPIDAPNYQTVSTEDGTLVSVVACPADKSDRVSCATCALCADSSRDYVIGFRVHGARKKAANIIATQTIN